MIKICTLYFRAFIAFLYSSLVGGALTGLSFGLLMIIPLGPAGVVIGFVGFIAGSVWAAYIAFPAIVIGSAIIVLLLKLNFWSYQSLSLIALSLAYLTNKCHPHADFMPDLLYIGSIYAAFLLYGHRQYIETGRM